MLIKVRRITEYTASLSADEIDAITYCVVSTRERLDLEGDTSPVYLEQLRKLQREFLKLDLED